MKKGPIDAHLKHLPPSNFITLKANSFDIINLIDQANILLLPLVTLITDLLKEANLEIRVCVFVCVCLCLAVEALYC
jgi:hypothetical protein